jgi:uncharacterized protein YaeQ
MALSATVYRFDIELSDVDRGVYEKLELRAAQHPSEAMRYLLTRVLAYCVSHEEGIAFTRGLAVPDEPAIWIKDLQGATLAWIDIGTPSPERLHKAKKAVPRVSVFTHHDVEVLKKSVRASRVHRVEEIDVYAVEAGFLDALEALTERSNSWTLARSDGEVYVTAKGETLTTRLERHSLGGLGA